MMPARPTLFHSARTSSRRTAVFRLPFFGPSPPPKKGFGTPTLLADHVSPMVRLARSLRSLSPVFPQVACPLETPIPPEAVPGQATEYLSRAGEEEWGRFSEETDARLNWDPDWTAQPRLVESESVILEGRGLTPQTELALHLRPFRHRQLEFWRQSTVHKNSVALKLREAGWLAEAAKLELCHSYYTVCICNDCKLVRRFPNRCDQFYCPECQHALQAERQKQVAWWAKECKHPKHVVLTIKNIPDLTPGHVDEFRRMFTRLRRRKFARNWVGGFYRMECTNEGRGWHLHLHALVESRYISQQQLQEEWRNITNGLGYIVKVIPVRGESYIHEVTKYVVKGSMLAKWQPASIVTFIHAFLNKRTFGVFGSLYAKRTEFAEWIASLKEARPKCVCGSCNVTYLDEARFLLLDCQPTIATRERPPPSSQLVFPDWFVPAECGPR